WVSGIALSEIATCFPAIYRFLLRLPLPLWQAEGIHPVRPRGVGGGDVNGTAHNCRLRSKVVIERMRIGIDDLPQEVSCVRVKHRQSALASEPARFRD